MVLPLIVIGAIKMMIWNVDSYSCGWRHEQCSNSASGGKQRELFVLAITTIQNAADSRTKEMASHGNQQTNVA